MGGLPAKPLKRRFPAAVVEELLTLAWWNWPDEAVATAIDAIRSGDIAALRRVAGAAF